MWKINKRGGPNKKGGSDKNSKTNKQGGGREGGGGIIWNWRVQFGIVLVPCPTWKSKPTVFSGAVDISKVLGCHLLQQMSSQ